MNRPGHMERSLGKLNKSPAEAKTIATRIKAKTKKARSSGGSEPDLTPVRKDAASLLSVGTRVKVTALTGSNAVIEGQIGKITSRQTGRYQYVVEFESPEMQQRYPTGAEFQASELRPVLSKRFDNYVRVRKDAEKKVFLVKVIRVLKTDTGKLHIDSNLPVSAATADEAAEKAREHFRRHSVGPFSSKMFLIKSIEEM